MGQPSIAWATAPQDDASSYTPPDEREAVTAFAREQLAARQGGDPEDIGVRVDPTSAAAARDRALREYMERKQRLEAEREELLARRSQEHAPPPRRGRLAERLRARQVAEDPTPTREPAALAAVDGIGPAKQRALLERFGSVDAIAAASVEELTEVPGIGAALAGKLHDALNS